MITWRAFVGEEDWRTEEDQRGLTWSQARDVLLGFAQQAVADNAGGCEHCATKSRAAVDQLAHLPEGEEWDGDIDWDDLQLIRERQA